MGEGPTPLWKVLYRQLDCLKGNSCNKEFKRIISTAMSYVKKYGKLTTKENRVVCAAIRHKETGTIICGARHYDETMRRTIYAIHGHFNLPEEKRDPTLVPPEWWCCENGFVDSFGNWLTRAEAMKLAKERGQILFPDHNKKELFSEHLH